MIDVVVIGAGKWAHECWAPLLREFADRYTVRAVVDPRRESAISLARALGLPAHNAHALLASALSRYPEVTAGIVLSSPEHHAECIIELTECGLRVRT